MKCLRQKESQSKQEKIWFNQNNLDNDKWKYIFCISISNDFVHCVWSNINEKFVYYQLK